MHILTPRRLLLATVLLAPLSAQIPQPNAYGAADFQVEALLGTNTNNLVAGGWFTTIGGQPISGVAQWNGTAWSALGTAPVFARELLAAPGGGIVAAGDNPFGLGEVSVWNGAAWSSLGGSGATAPFNAPIFGLAQLNGSIVAGGVFQVPAEGLAVWDGVTWGPVGTPFSPGSVVLTAANMANGDLIVGGSVIVPGTGTLTIARWTGSSWRPLSSAPTLTDFVYRLRVLANGDVLASTYDPANAVYELHRFTAAAGWTRIARLDSVVEDMVELPGGEIVVGGGFTTINGVAVGGLGIFDGANWTELANLQSAPFTGAALALAFLPSAAPVGAAQLAVGGIFTTLNGAPTANNLLAFGPRTTAAVASYGIGCNGNLLAPLNTPLLGVNFQSLATGLVANSIALQVRGLTNPASPLPAPGLPGCFLWSDLGVLDNFVATGTSAVVSFPIPNTPSLAGSTLLHQVINLYDNASGVLEATSTNGQAVLIGRF